MAAVTKSPWWLQLDRPMEGGLYTACVIFAMDIPIIDLCIGRRVGVWHHAILGLELAISMTLLAAISSRRMLDLGVPRWWSVPYALVALGPLTLRIAGRVNLPPLVLILIILQLPLFLANGRYSARQNPTTPRAVGADPAPGPPGLA